MEQRIPAGDNRIVLGSPVSTSYEDGDPLLDREFFADGQLRSLLVVNIGRPAQHSGHDRLPRLPYESVVTAV